MIETTIDQLIAGGWLYAALRITFIALIYLFLFVVLRTTVRELAVAARAMPGDVGRSGGSWSHRARCRRVVAGAGSHLESGAGFVSRPCRGEHHRHRRPAHFRSSRRTAVRARPVVVARSGQQQRYVGERRTCTRGRGRSPGRCHTMRPGSVSFRPVFSRAQHRSLCLNRRTAGFATPGARFEHVPTGNCGTS